MVMFLRCCAALFVLFWAGVLFYLGCDIGKDWLWPPFYMQSNTTFAFVGAAAEFSLALVLVFLAAAVFFF